MPNKNYLAGRRLEYEVKKDYEDCGNIVLRTAGSHGFADLVILDPVTGLTLFVQCKRVTTEAQFNSLIKKTKDNPKLPFSMMLAIKMKGQKGFHEHWLGSSGVNVS